MEYRVIKKQYNGTLCYVCGIHNDHGIQAQFYQLENDHVVGIFKPEEHHQGYPGIMHGGLSAAMLDETIGRSIQAANENTWWMTIELTTKYLKPVPLYKKLYCVGYLTKKTSRIFTGEGYIYDEDDNIYVTATSKYIIKDLDQIVQTENFVKEQWFFVKDDEDIKTLKVPK
ncbi:MAG: PaaI family thioesterase [Acholeplasmataceae bacterium]|nr:PaaI family thioesterase [Acholeplasmataceae bacterium]